MRTLTRSDFQKICDVGGYMIYYLGHGVGGAGTLSHGKGIKGRAIRKQIKDYSEQAEIMIEGIIKAGDEGQYYKRLCEIDEIVSKY
jgi:hypothetical protein